MDIQVKPRFGVRMKKIIKFGNLFRTGPLKLAATFHGLEHCNLVSVFDVAAGWNPGGDASDF
jgi:hypothetical protein